MLEMEELIREVLDRIRSVQQEGLVDHRLEEAYGKKSNICPQFLMHLLSIYCLDIRLSLRTIKETLDQTIVVDFGKVDRYCSKIIGASSCVGACRVILRCHELRRACDSRSKEECFAAVCAIENEFLPVQEKFNSILEIEKRIVSLEMGDQ